MDDGTKTQIEGIVSRGLQHSGVHIGLFCVWWRPRERSQRLQTMNDKEMETLTTISWSVQLHKWFQNCTPQVRRIIRSEILKL